MYLNFSTNFRSLQTLKSQYRACQNESSARRHPDALVALFVSLLLKSGGVCAAAAASLRPLTK
jgi:hypothetical protein